MVRSSARFHADRARRQGRDHFVELGARDLRLAKLHIAPYVHAVQGKHVLGEIDADRDNSHGLPLSSELMRFATPSWHSVAVRRNARLAWDGEVPFIR